MRFVGRGHEAVRATHDKTLELIPGSSLTGRGTCIVAVDVAVDAGGGPAPAPASAMAGPVQITLTAGSASFGLHAVANPSWVPGGPIVVRRSPLRLPGTFATEASAAASDLPRELVEALRDPGMDVRVDVSPVPGDVPTVVLFLADGSAAGDAGLPAELAVADTVLAEDPEALALIGRHDARPGHRTLVVATRDLPGRSAAALVDAAVRIETVGLPARFAAAAAAPGPSPVTYGGADPVATVRTAPAGHRVVLTVDADDLAALLALAADLRGTSAAVVTQEHAPPVRVVGGAVPDGLTRGPVHVCLPVAADTAPDPAVRAAIVALLADGVPTRTAAKALAALAGWDRRRAYDAVLGWRR